jgi:tetratricopeptide (TPR) repeat protein
MASVVDRTRWNPREETPMRRASGVLAAVMAAAVLLVAGAMAAEVLTNDAVVAMVKAGLGDDVIITKIRATPGRYDLTTQGIIALKNAGVSDRLIHVMLAAPASTPGAPTPAPPAAAQLERDAIALYQQGKATEALALFERALQERPGDDGLIVGKALAQLEQARMLREQGSREYKPLVVGAYAALRPLGRRQAGNPDWNFAMAKAFWLNDRPDRTRRVVDKVLVLRPDYHEAHLLAAALTYEEALDPSAFGRPGPRDETTRWRDALACRTAYENALAVPGMPARLKAEAHYRLGLVSEVLEKKPLEARQCWERAVAADPASFFGRRAAEKLQAAK